MREKEGVRERGGREEDKDGKRSTQLPIDRKEDWVWLDWAWIEGGKVCKEEYSGLIETQRESNPNGLGKRDR